LISEKPTLEEIAQFINPSRFEEIPYAMIGCYLDESFDIKQQGIFAVGGIMGRGRPAFELDRKWEALRKRPDIDIEYFKASECQNGTKQFRKFVSDPITDAERVKLDGIWKDFLELLAGDSVERFMAYGIGVVQDDFYEVIKDPYAKSILGDSPYWFAYCAAMIKAADVMKRSTGERAAFVCDEDEEHSAVAPTVYAALKSKNPNAAKYMGSFTSLSDLCSGSLQAADALVYEVRRSLGTTLGRWKETLKWNSGTRWQFRQIISYRMMWMVAYADKRHLEQIVKENKPGEPLNLDHWLEQEINQDVTL
jgi:hypothetical protein